MRVFEQFSPLHSRHNSLPKNLTRLSSSVRVCQWMRYLYDIVQLFGRLRTSQVT